MKLGPSAMMLRNLLGSPATTERTRARGEKTSGQEREGVGAVQSLALVRVREEAGLGRRARGGLDPCETDLHDSGGLCHARHRKHWAWPDIVTWTSWLTDAAATSKAKPLPGAI